LQDQNWGARRETTRAAAEPGARAAQVESRGLHLTAYHRLLDPMQRTRHRDALTSLGVWSGITSEAPGRRGREQLAVHDRAVDLHA